MKSILEFLCFALFTTAISTGNSCDPWPSDLKSVWECCDFPTPVASDEESKCDEICGKQTNLEAKKCMVECFSRSTKLLTAEKKINKSEVMIHPSLFPSGHNLAWGPIMVKAIDKCDFEPTDDVNLDLAKFFHCVRAEMIKNCLFFKLLTEGCALVEEHFNKCNDIKPNCSIPAEEIFKADCCVSPELFKADLVDECEHQCKEKEFFRDLKRKCFLDCIINATKVIENGKVDFKVVKSLLVENSNKSDEWEKSIDMSVKNCEIAYTGLENINYMAISNLFLRINKLSRS